MAVLVQISLTQGGDDNPTLQELVVTREGTIIGRRTGAPNGLNLELDFAASRRHCRLWSEQEDVWLEDLQSLSGTYVNGTILREPHRVRSGDEVHLGKTVIRFGAVTVISAPPTDGC